MINTVLKSEKHHIPQVIWLRDFGLELSGRDDLGQGGEWEKEVG